MGFLTTILYVVVGLVVGAVAGFMFARKKFEKELKENPPITEKMVRAMFMQMGRKPSEAQIKQVMRSMNAGR